MNTLATILMTMSLSASSVAGDMQEMREEIYKNKFSGWEGIVFYCSYEASDQMLSDLCKRTTTDLELLSAANDVPIKIAEPNNYIQALITSDDNQYVVLEYSLIGTKGSGKYSTKSVYGNLSYNINYGAAVNANSDDKARSGVLSLWSQDLIGHGTGQEFINQFSDQAETLLKKSITVFLEGSKQVAGPVYGT